MTLFIVHHADALAPEVDPQRPLSPHGRAHAEQLAASAAARGVKPDVVWHSGKLRARQTAEIFWRACNPLAELSAIHGLQPGDPPQWIADKLIGEARAVMIVGHMPHLPQLLQTLTRSAAEPFPPHGIVELTLEGDVWSERWRS